MQHPARPLSLRAGGSESPDRFLVDLAEIVKDDLSVYLSIGPNGAVLSVKSPETFAFGESVDARWAHLSPRKRAEKILDWIGRAAAYCRSPRIRYEVPEDPVA